MNYDKIMEIHWKCHMRARRQQCVDSEYLMDFAKMVADECASIAVQNQSGWEAGMRIKKHFGVEE